MTNNGLQDIDTAMDELWMESMNQIAIIDPARENWKAQSLPLARIKKIMKIEEGVSHEMERERLDQAGNSEIKQQTRFMIAGEAPVLLGKACELLIKEISARAWRHTERNRRRTLQRQDVYAAVGESEVYDFLIDIVPRMAPTQTIPAPMPAASPSLGGPMGNYPDQQHQMHGIPQQAPMPMPMAVPVPNQQHHQQQQHQQQPQHHQQQQQQQVQEMGVPDQGQYIQMHQMHADPNQLPTGYEHYYMQQMHQARMQAEAAAANSPMPQTAFMGQPDQGMVQWGVPQQQQQQQHHQGQNVNNPGAPPQGP